MKRVAIYARKSIMSDKGDSIMNQVKKCKEFMNFKFADEEKAYIVYDKDEGFTGANTFRPDFQRMIRDVQANKIDILVCFRLDRMSRSVADCANTVKLLEKHNVVFYSATEGYETASPYGKAMMSMAMVFAELEREALKERVTSNMYMLAETERWVGGKAPLGYKLDRVDIPGTRKKQTILKVDRTSSKKVRVIFKKYIEFRSMTKLETYLLQNHIKSQNDRDLSTSQLATILKNPVYVMADERVMDFYVRQGAKFYGELDGARGLMTYGKHKARITDEGKHTFDKMTADNWVVSVGVHRGIVTADTWLEAQRIMAENHDKFPSNQKSHTALVSGLLRCSKCDTPMAVTYGAKDKEGNKVYYYCCKMRKKSKGSRCSNENVRADMIDRIVINEIKSKGIDKERFVGNLRERLRHNKIELNHNPVEFIRSDIKRKEREIERLRKRIRETDHNELVVDYENDIVKLRRELSNLTAELSTIGERKTVVYQTESVLSFIETLLDKCGQIDILDLEEKQNLVRLLFKCIKWDSVSGSLSFEYIADDNSGGDDDDGGGSGGNGGGNRGGGSGGFTALESVILGDSDISHFYSQTFPIGLYQSNYQQHYRSPLPPCCH